MMMLDIVACSSLPSGTSSSGRFGMPASALVNSSSAALAACFLLGNAGLAARDFRHQRIGAASRPWSSWPRRFPSRPRCGAPAPVRVCRIAARRRSSMATRFLRFRRQARAASGRGRRLGIVADPFDVVHGGCRTSLRFAFQTARSRSIVMAGLVPAISFRWALCVPYRDRRGRPGDDSGGCCARLRFKHAFSFSRRWGSARGLNDPSVAPQKNEGAERRRRLWGGCEPSRGGSCDAASPAAAGSGPGCRGLRLWRSAAAFDIPWHRLSPCAGESETLEGPRPAGISASVARQATEDHPEAFTQEMTLRAPGPMRLRVACPGAAPAPRSVSPRERPSADGDGANLG